MCLTKIIPYVNSEKQNYNNFEFKNTFKYTFLTESTYFSFNSLAGTIGSSGVAFTTFVLNLT